MVSVHFNAQTLPVIYWYTALARWRLRTRQTGVQTPESVSWALASPSVCAGHWDRRDETDGPAADLTSFPYTFRYIQLHIALCLVYFTYVGSLA